MGSPAKTAKGKARTSVYAEPEGNQSLGRNGFVFKNTKSSQYISHALRTRSARKGRERKRARAPCS